MPDQVQAPTKAAPRTANRRRLVKVGREFFNIRNDSGILDDTKHPIVFCATCTGMYEGADIYHRATSAIYR